MYALNYVKAKSVEEAAGLVARNPEAKLLAGGMTLIPTLKARLARPTHLVDISSLPELRRIGVKGGKLTIGAGARHHDVATSAVVKKAVPALAGLAGEIGDPQVRNRGTLGGSLANNDPAADYPAAVLGLGATVVTTKRSIAAEDFFQGLFTDVIEGFFADSGGGGFQRAMRGHDNHRNRRPVLAYFSQDIQPRFRTQLEVK